MVSAPLDTELCGAARGSSEQGCGDEGASRWGVRSQIRPRFKCKEVSSVCNKCPGPRLGAARGCARGRGWHRSPWSSSELQKMELRLSGGCHGPQPSSKGPLWREAEVGVFPPFLFHPIREGPGRGDGGAGLGRTAGAIHAAAMQHARFRHLNLLCL